MAGSKYAYVKDFELPDTLLPGTYMILRVDGRSFHRQVSAACKTQRKTTLRADARHRFAEEHAFEKPNDLRALKLMDQAATAVMTEFRDVVLAFGESDEFRSAYDFAIFAVYSCYGENALASCFENQRHFITGVAQRLSRQSSRSSRHPTSFTGRRSFPMRRSNTRPCSTAASCSIHLNSTCATTLPGDRQTVCRFIGSLFAISG
jgi:tRNA(His) 5'-end guanylyltransferase